MLCIFFAGARISKGNSLILSAAVRVPLGSWKTLLDSCPIGMNAKLCFLAPTFDVAALSATMDGMVLLRTFVLIVLSERLLIVSSLFDICSLTWQSGGVVSANM
jgi:hypothetical protein